MKEFEKYGWILGYSHENSFQYINENIENLAIYYITNAHKERWTLTDLEKGDFLVRIGNPYEECICHVFKTIEEAISFAEMVG